MDQAGTRAQRARKRMYKPAITSLPSLLCLLLVTLTLIALTELACHRLQNADKTSHSHERRQGTPIVKKRSPGVNVKRNGTALFTNAGPPSTTSSLSQSNYSMPTICSSSNLSATVISGSFHLDDGGGSSPTAPAVSSAVYLSVGGSPSTVVGGMPGPVYLPIGSGSSSATIAALPSPVYLPVSGADSTLTAAAPSPFIFTVDKDGASSTLPAQTEAVSLPLGGGPIPTSVGLGLPVYLPIGADSSQSHPTRGSPVPNPLGDTSAPDGQGAGFETIPIPQAFPGTSKGVAAGIPYSFGAGGLVVMDGSTFITSIPTTAILSDGRVAVIGPDGAVAIEKSRTDSSDLTTGEAAGVAYTLGPQGSLVLGGLTLETSSPTTATLQNGQVAVVGPSGAVAFQGLTHTGPWSPIIGTADGVVYSIGPGGVAAMEGQTFQSSSPTTATLRDGHMVIVGPAGAIAVANPVSTYPASTFPPTPVTGMADGVPYTMGPGGVLVIESHTFKKSSPTTTTFGDGHILIVEPTGGVSLQDQTPQAGKSESLSIRDYVIGAFIPTLIAVMFSIPWHVLSSAINEMEPFFQLQRADGAPAEMSICLSYKASITPISTVNALRNGHFLVWSSGLLSLVTLLIPPLSSETVFIGFTNITQCKITSAVRQNCYPVLSVYPLAARVIEGVLAFVAVITLAILITLSHKKTGVYADPISIAGLVTLFQDRRVIEDFRRINAYWPDTKQLKNTLRGYRYRIGAYTDNDGSPSYGLMSVHTNVEAIAIAHRAEVSTGDKNYTSSAVKGVKERLRTPTKRQSTISAIFIHSATLVFFASMISGLLALVVYYYKNSSQNSFEAFMDNQSFGTSFLFTTIGVLIKVYMTYLDNDLRLNHPYRLMSMNPTHPRYSILPSPPSNPFAGLFHSLAHSNPLSAYISLTTILCEFLIVALATVPFKLTSSFVEFVISTWLTVAILSMVLIGLICMLYSRWTLRKRARLYAIAEGKGGGSFNRGEARAPESLAESLWLLCGSRMVGDFQGMAFMHRSERDEIVRKWGCVYEIGPVVGLDSVKRVAVEEAVPERNE